MDNYVTHEVLDIARGELLTRKDKRNNKGVCLTKRVNSEKKKHITYNESRERWFVREEGIEPTHAKPAEDT